MPGWKHINPGVYEEITVANGDHVMFHTASTTSPVEPPAKLYDYGTACGESTPATTPSPIRRWTAVSFVLHTRDFEVTATETAHFTSAMQILGQIVGNLIIRSFEDSNAVKIVALATWRWWDVYTRRATPKSRVPRAVRSG